MAFLAFGEGGWRNGSLSSQWQSTHNNTGRTWKSELARKICEVTRGKERWSNRTNIRDRQNLKWNVADCSSRLRFYLDRNYQDGKEKWEYFCYLLKRILKYFVFLLTVLHHVQPFAPCILIFVTWYTLLKKTELIVPKRRLSERINGCLLGESMWLSQQFRTKSHK